MKVMQRLLLMLAVLILGLAVVATRSTAQEPSVPWAPDCSECGGIAYGDPDGGGGGGFDGQSARESYRSVRAAGWLEQRVWWSAPVLARFGLIRWIFSRI